MTPAEHRFTLRLLALLVAVAALWQLGCRPAFSPDGRRVLFLARADGNQLLVACHDRTSGATTALFTPPLRTLALPLWTADGQHAVVLWGREKGREPHQHQGRDVVPVAWRTQRKRGEAARNEQVNGSMVQP